MSPIAVGDEKAVLEASHSLLSCTSFLELTHVTLRTLERLLGADSSCFSLAYHSEEEQRLHRLCGFGRVTTDDMRVYQQAYRRSDPVLTSMLSREWIGLNRIVVLERLVDMSRFTGTEIYSDFFRPRAIHHVMGLSIALGDDTRALLGLHLPKDAHAGFAARHLEIARCMVPAIAASFTQMLLREQLQDREAIIEALARGEPHQGLIVLDEHLRVLFIDPTGRQYLRRLHCAEGQWDVARLALPPRLRARVAQAITASSPARRTSLASIDPREHGRDRGVPAMSLRPLAAAGASARYLLAFDAPRARPPAVQTALAPLSPREAELAELVALGHSNAEIGARLHLSVRTVENHLRSIYGKLQLRNRAALARLLGAASAH